MYTMANVERIETALRHKFCESANDEFEITMKSTGHKLLIQRKFNAPHKSCGHWHGRSAYFVVTGDGFDGEKCFKSFETMAKAIKAGFLK
jgi:hypothetical protein